MGVLWEFKSEETVPDAFPRMADALLVRIEVLLRKRRDHRAETVHELRVTTKRLRALLRLVRPVISPTVYRRENDRLRAAARLLSPLRDTRVAHQTLARHQRTANKQRQRKAFRRVIKAACGLDGPKSHWERSREKALHRAAATLSSSLRALRSLRPAGAEWKALAPGLKRSYRLSRHHMDCALSGRKAADFHEWRKRTKDLLYQLEMLQRAWPKHLRKVIRRLDQLQQHLGRHNDLAVLTEILQRDPALCGGQEAVSEVTAYLEKQSRKLRRRSFALGERLLAHKPSQFVRRLGHHWQSWHHTG